MTEISTEELAQWLESYADFRYATDDTKTKLTQAAARLRSLAEDAERLDWLAKQGIPGLGWIARDSWTGRGYRLHQTQAVTFMDVSETPRQAIDKARHD